MFESFGAPNLKRFFAGAKFTGKQKLYKRRDPVLESIGKKGDDRKMAKVQLMNSFGENILSRLRLLVQQSGQSLDAVFSQFDTDGSGELSRTEFRKALRALNLGLTILEINEIIRLVDVADLTGHTRYDKVEGDGKINIDIARMALQRLGIDEQGLDGMDRKIMSTIQFKFDGGPVGIDNLATAIGEEANTIEDVYEPYLIIRGFLQRTRQGRILTSRGKQHLGVKTSIGPLFDVN